MKIKNNIFVSSTCFKSRDLQEIISLCESHKISNLEISGNIKYQSSNNLIKIFEKYKHFNFRFHNYFPVPKNPFVINLAHSETISKSLSNIKKAMSLSSKYGGNIFSFHSGFLFNPNFKNLGGLQNQFQEIKLDEAYKNFETSIKDLYRYNIENNIILCIENNVVEKHNYIKNHNRYLFSFLSDSRFIRQLITKYKIKILLDLAHLKISANVLGFDKNNFIDKYLDHIKIVHMSENNGLTDQNFPLNSDTWFWKKIKWHKLEYISLEIKNCTIKEIKDQIKLVSEMI